MALIVGIKSRYIAWEHPTGGKDQEHTEAQSERELPFIPQFQFWHWPYNSCNIFNLFCRNALFGLSEIFNRNSQVVRMAVASRTEHSNQTLITL